MTFSSVVDSLTALMEDDIFNFPHSSASGEKLIYDTQTHVRVSDHPSVSSERSFVSGKCTIGVPTTSSASALIISNQSCDQLCSEVEFVCKWASLREKYERLWSPGWKSNDVLCIQKVKEVSSNVAHTQKYSQSSSRTQQDQIERKLVAQIQEPMRMSRPLTRLEGIVVSTLKGLVAIARKRNPLAPLEEVERECMSYLLNGCKGPSPYENVINGTKPPDNVLVSDTPRLGSCVEPRSSEAQAHQQHQSHISGKHDTVQERDAVKPFNDNTSLPKEPESIEEAKECEMLAKLREERLASLPRRSKAHVHQQHQSQSSGKHDTVQKRDGVKPFNDNTSLPKELKSIEEAKVREILAKLREECLTSLPRRSEAKLRKGQHAQVYMNAHRLNSFPKSSEGKAEEKQRPLAFHVENNITMANKFGEKGSATSPSGVSASGLASIPMGENKGRINRKRPASHEQPAAEESPKKRFHSQEIL